jgi:hypothetical protein
MYLKATLTRPSPVLPPPDPDPPVGFFAAPNVSPGQGDGSLGNPWNFWSAVGDSSIGAGDTIWLRSGTYQYAGGPDTMNQDGTEANPIVWRSYPETDGSHAIIDFHYPGDLSSLHSLKVRGNYIQLRDLEFFSSDPRDRIGDNATVNAGQRRGQVNIRAPYVRIINCITHELHSGFSHWEESTDSVLYGCIMYNNGWIYDPGGPDHKQWNHGVYAHSLDSKLVKDNLNFQNYGYGFHLWSSNPGGGTTGFTLEGNIGFMNSYAPGIPYETDGDFLLGGRDPVIDGVFTENYSYCKNRDVDVRFGGNVLAGSSITMTDNYFASGLVRRRRDFANETYSNNTAVGLTAGTTMQQWNGSQYVSWSPSGWTKTTTPTGTVTAVRPNDYENNRGHVAIFNWDQLDNISVDLSPILANNMPYTIWHAYDLVNPILTGTYTGGTVAIPMAERDAPPPIPDGFFGTEIKCPKEFAALLIRATNVADRTDK